MRIIKAVDFTASKAWDALHIDTIDNATVRLHWTDQPYRWHVNDGAEVFVLLHGEVDMHTRKGLTQQIHRLQVGDIFHAESGDEHVAHPIGVARVLVVERAGSA